MSAAVAMPIRVPRVRRKPGPSPMPSREELRAMRKIAEIVSDATGVRLADMHSRRRTIHVALARQLAWYVMRTACPQISYPQLGAFFDRDHTTALHGVEQIRKRIDGKTLLLAPMLRACAKEIEYDETFFRVGDMPASRPMTGILA